MASPAAGVSSSASEREPRFFRAAGTRLRPRAQSARDQRVPGRRRPHQGAGGARQERRRRRRGRRARASGLAMCSPSTACPRRRSSPACPARWRWAKAPSRSPCSALSTASRRRVSRLSASRIFSATGWCAGARSASALKIFSARSPRCRPAISSCMSITASGASSGSNRSGRRRAARLSGDSLCRRRQALSCRSRTSSF